MKPIVLLVLTAAGIMISCSTKETLPKDLNESITYFERHWSSAELDDFKNKEEHAAVTELHFSVGMWIRNNWIHGDRNPELIKFFDSLKFRHADDISSTILTSLHRKLNNKDIDLQGQIAYYEAYWRPILECEEKHKNEMLAINTKIKVGDTLVMIYPVDTAQNSRAAVAYPCPHRDWTFDEKKDLRVDGIVTKKFDLGNSENPFINYKIVKMNYANTKIFMKEVNIGDTVESSLGILTFEWN